MSVYIGIDITIIILGLLLIHSKVSVGERVINGEKWFFFITALLLIFFSAFRGDFSADYNGYSREIWSRFSNYSIIDIINRGVTSNPEPGYLIFQYAVRKLTDNSLYIFIFSSILIVVSNLKEIKRSNALPYLCVFLFVEAGNYYESFNIMRQIMSVSIVLLGSRFLFERKFWKYLFFVLLASTFHISALIMIPFYFVSGMKLGRKSLVIYPIAILFLLIVQDRILKTIIEYIWSWYDTNVGGYSWKNVIAGGLISILALVLYYTNNRSRLTITDVDGRDVLKDIQLEENIYLSSAYLYLLFLLMGLYFSYAKRFSCFFSLYLICFCCKQIEYSPLKKILLFMLIVFFIVFGFVTKIDIPYYFVWNS